jgi:hypothetical protein
MVLICASNSIPNQDLRVPNVAEIEHLRVHLQCPNSVGPLGRPRAATRLELINATAFSHLQNSRNGNLPFRRN